MSGIEATRRITADIPDICIIGMSIHDEDKVVKERKTQVPRHTCRKPKLLNRSSVLYEWMLLTLVGLVELIQYSDSKMTVSG